MQSLSSMLPWMTGITVAASTAFYAQHHFKWMGGTLPVRDMPSFKPEHKEAEMKNRFNCVSACSAEFASMLHTHCKLACSRTVDAICRLVRQHLKILSY